MKSLSQCQFHHAFSNKSGNVAIRFNGISTWLTIPWRDFIRHVPCFTSSIQQARLNAAVEEVVKSQCITASASNLFQESSFKTERAKQFQHWFDCYCEHAFLNCMNSYNDYSQPLLIPDDFMNYLYLLKRIFPQQWEFLATGVGL